MEREEEEVEGVNTGIIVVGLIHVRGSLREASFTSTRSPGELNEDKTTSDFKGLDSSSRLPLCNLVHRVALMKEHVVWYGGYCLE